MKPRFANQLAQVSNRVSSEAFTLLELVVVLFTLSSLVALVLVTVGAARPNTTAIRCMNNHRQLVLAWTMYAEENKGKLACNRDGGNVGKSSADAAWVGGWLDYSSSPDNTNASLLVDHVHWPYGAYLGPYVHSPSVFKCPTDPSEVNIAGVRMPRVRSVSMSCYIGQKARAWTSPSRYASYVNITQIQVPAQIFVLLDENPASINDGCFFSNPDVRWNIIDYPASYHNGAGSFSFADGHAELHKWKDPRTMPSMGPGELLPLNTILSGNVDIDWMEEHVSQLR
jgi:prepilin-type processing-associated H-X9-DG protein